VNHFSAEFQHHASVINGRDAKLTLRCLNHVGSDDWSCPPAAALPEREAKSRKAPHANRTKKFAHKNKFSPSGFRGKYTPHRIFVGNHVRWFLARNIAREASHHFETCGESVPGAALRVSLTPGGIPSIRVRLYSGGIASWPIILQAIPLKKRVPAGTQCSMARGISQPKRFARGLHLRRARCRCHAASRVPQFLPVHRALVRCAPRPENARHSNGRSIGRATRTHKFFKLVFLCRNCVRRADAIVAWSRMSYGYMAARGL